MPERGGPTAQSGFLYQNTVTASFVARLCDAPDRPDSTRVLAVRTEASVDVDDTVVTYADGHCDYIQAKENVDSSGETWERMWHHLVDQFFATSFDKQRDHLKLYFGNDRGHLRALDEICRRAQSSVDNEEWLQRLSKEQIALRSKIKDLLKIEDLLRKAEMDVDLADEYLRVFFARIRVEITSLHNFENYTYRWLPPIKRGGGPTLVLSVLRDIVAGSATNREEIDRARLEQLLRDKGIEFGESYDLGVLRSAVKECSALLLRHPHQFGETEGTHIQRELVTDIVGWARSDTLDRTALLLNNAGMGKSVVMQDVALALKEEGVTCLAVKADVQWSNIEEWADLGASLHLPDTVERLASRLADYGLFVVIIDQVDALSYAMARNEQALKLVIDLIARLSMIQGVRILVSCRSFDWETDPRLRAVAPNKRFTIPSLSVDEVVQILGKIGVSPSDLSQSTRDLLRTPIYLDLFVRSVQKAPDVSYLLYQVASLQGLYHHVWEHVIMRAGASAPTSVHRQEALFAVMDYVE